MSACRVMERQISVLNIWPMEIYTLTRTILQELHGDHTEAQTPPPSPEQGPGNPEPDMTPQNAPENKPLAFTKVDALKFLLANQE